MHLHCGGAHAHLPHTQTSTRTHARTHTIEIKIQINCNSKRKQLNTEWCIHRIHYQIDHTSEPIFEPSICANGFKPISDTENKLAHDSIVRKFMNGKIFFPSEIDWNALTMWWWCPPWLATCTEQCVSKGFHICELQIPMRQFEFHVRYQSNTEESTAD